MPIKVTRAFDKDILLQYKYSLNSDYVRKFDVSLYIIYSTYGTPDTRINRCHVKHKIYRLKILGLIKLTRLCLKEVKESYPTTSQQSYFWFFINRN